MQCWHHASISFSSHHKLTSTTKITFLNVRKTQKNIVMPMFTKCREHFFLNIHKMQRKHFYANCRCSQTVCQTAQQGGARQRGKGAKLNKRNLTFTISKFSIYTKHYLRHYLRTIQLADERYVKWLLLSVIIFSQQETWCNCFKKATLTEPHIAEVSLRVVRRK